MIGKKEICLLSRENWFLAPIFIAQVAIWPRFGDKNVPDPPPAKPGERNRVCWSSVCVSELIKSRALSIRVRDFPIHDVIPRKHQAPQTFVDFSSLFIRDRNTNMCIAEESWFSLFFFFFFTTAPRKVAIFITFTGDEYILVCEGYFSLTISRHYKRGPRRNAKMSKISTSRPNTSRETMKYETKCLVEKMVRKKTMRSRYIMR